MNYLIPTDANPLNENQVEFDCINVNQILSLMSDASNDTNFIILDACRNNPFERSWHRSPTLQGLSYMSAPYGTLIAYSTAPDKTASDGEGSNGLYTSVLVDEIISPNLTILQVLQNVRLKLINLSKGEQVPWESTSLLQDFVFNDNRYVSISTFCQSVLYSHDRDIVLNNLKLDIWSLSKLSKLKIPINKEDVEAGVIEVYVKSKVNYFDVFDELEIHIYKNGERDYNLYTLTKNASQVFEISQEIYNKLGGGLYDDERFSSFRDYDKINNIARGKAKLPQEQCFTMWIFDYVSFTLKYLINPNKQFVFTVRIKPNKKVVQKTISEILLNDYSSLISSAVKIMPTGEHKGKYVDYHTSLPIHELNFFNTAVIRKFISKEKSKSSTSIFLTNSDTSNINIIEISNLVGKLTSIYGVDRSGEGYLSGYEEENLKAGRYWSGRTWDLNIQHQIQDLDSAIEEMLYGVHLNYDDEIKGLELSIFGYERLIDYINEN